MPCLNNTQKPPENRKKSKFSAKKYNLFSSSASGVTLVIFPAANPQLRGCIHAVAAKSRPMTQVTPNGRHLRYGLAPNPTPARATLKGWATGVPMPMYCTKMPSELSTAHTLPDWSTDRYR